MRRRDIVALFGGAAAGVLVAPRLAGAQPAGKIHRVAIILGASPVSTIEGPDPQHPQAKAFFQEMRALGYVEGRNLVIERRSAEGKRERIGEIVAELVDRRVDVVFATTPIAALEAKRVTNTVPIVAFTTDAVADGLAASLARPGGNLTGFAIYAGPEIYGVLVQMLKEAVPEATNFALIASRNTRDWPATKQIWNVANKLGLATSFVENDSNDFAALFATILLDRPHALIITGSLNFANRKQIADFVTEHRIPSFHDAREFVVVGGLMSYGVNFADLYRRAAGHVDKILKGAKPADIPVEQPTRYELVVNLKTAKALGLNLPQTILARADEVIE